MPPFRIKTIGSKSMVTVSGVHTAGCSSPLGRPGTFEIHQKPADTVSGACLQHARSNSCRSWPSNSQLQMPALSALRPGPGARPFLENEIEKCTESSGAQKREHDLLHRRSLNARVVAMRRTRLASAQPLLWRAKPLKHIKLCSMRP